MIPLDTHLNLAFSGLYIHQEPKPLRHKELFANIITEFWAGKGKAPEKCFALAKLYSVSRCQVE